MVVTLRRLLGRARADNAGVLPLYVAEGCSAVCGLLLVRLVASTMSAGELNELFVYRRSTSFLQPLVLLGLPVAIPVYVARFPELARRFARYGLICGSVCTLALLAVLLVSGDLRHFVMGPDSGSQEAVVFSLYAFTITVYTVFSGVLRGRMRFRRLALLQGLGWGGTPILAWAILYAFGALTICGLFLAMSFLLLCFMGVLHWRAALYPTAGEATETIWRERVRDIRSYALVRIPVDGLMGAFFLVPMLQTTAQVPAAEAAVFNLLVTMGSLAAALTGPFTVVWLPRLAAGHSVHGQARRDAMGFLLAGTAIGAVLALSAFFAPILLRVCLGEKYVAYDAQLWVGLMGLFGLTVYMFARTVIDAHSRLPYHLGGIVLGLLAFQLIGTPYVFDVGKPFWGILAANSILGAFAVLSVLVIHRRGVPPLQMPAATRTEDGIPQRVDSLPPAKAPE